MLDGNERGAGQDEHGEATGHHRRGPAPRARLDKGHGEASQTHHPGDLSSRVDAVGPAWRGGKVPGGKEQTASADRDVHEEHRAPPEARHQRATRHRAGPSSDAGHCAPDPERPAAGRLVG